MVSTKHKETRLFGRDMFMVVASRTFRDIVHVLQGVGSALEGGKGLELDHLAKLGEIRSGGSNISKLGANLL